jgi:predicted phosphodiesterase
MNGKYFFKLLKTLFEKSPERDISKKDKIIIFSDLHLGNGKSGDDFAHNGDFFHHLLKNYYYPRGYHLVLNGDVEELHKFSLKEIRASWGYLYKILEKFQLRQGLTKLQGNHDFNLYKKKEFLLKLPVTGACKLNYKGNIIFIFHGHQAEYFFRFIQSITAFIVRFVAHPLGIKNYSVAFNSRRRYQVEKRIYNFARKHKILAVIGHTHRPLFESLSKIDSLKFKIERYCRIYPAAESGRQKELEKLIEKFKSELEKLLQSKKRKSHEENLYARIPMVPCLFNSGCCIGKNGITAIEIKEGYIELVYWFDNKRSGKYFDFGEYRPTRFGRSDYWRVSLNKESLEYVFTRIKLLS